jgi:hypothetical protein
MIADLPVEAIWQSSDVKQELAASAKMIDAVSIDRGSNSG